MFTKFKRLTWKASLMATTLSLLVSTIVLAASGDLDTTFSGDGLVTSYVVPSNLDRRDKANDVAIKANGKIAVAGQSFNPFDPNSRRDFAVVLYNADGTLDTTFSNDGRQITHFGLSASAYGVAIQSDGKIVLAGNTCTDFTDTDCNVALARYRQNGILDTTFSGDGKQISDFGGGDNGGSGGVALQPNGRIVVAGYMWSGTDYDFAVYRYLPNGNLDSSFSGDGKASFDFGGGWDDRAHGLALQPDGKIVVTGDSINSNGSNFAVMRLNENGSPDMSFSDDGGQITSFGAEDSALGVALQSDGKIVLVGYRDTGSIRSFAVVRYDANGNLDPTFNGTGKKAFSVVSNKYSSASDVIIQSDGKIVVLGGADAPNVSSDSAFALVRLNDNGSFDVTFSGNGKALIDFGLYDAGAALAIQPDGKYVLAGYTKEFYAFPPIRFALARVLP